MITIEHAPESVVSTFNPMLFRVTSDNFAEPNFYYKLVLEMDDSLNPITVELFEYPKASSGTGLAEFDIRKCVHDYMEESSFPNQHDSPSETLTFSTGRVVLLHVRIYEIYGEPPVLDTVNFYQWLLSHGGTVIDDGLAVRGGFSYENLPEEKYFFHFLQANLPVIPWLTWCPDKMLINYNQPLYLSFYNSIIYSGDTTRRITIYYTDATTETVDFTLTLTLNFLYEFTLSPSFLDLKSIQPTKKIHRFTVVLINDGDNITPIRTYYIDYEKHISERYLLFQNSLCGLDTLRLTGEGAFNADYTGDFVELYKGQYSRANGSYRNISNNEQAGRSANTGWISRAEVMWIRDLYLSRYRYELVNGKLVPIKITGKKLALPENADSNAVSLEWQYLFKNNVYTPYLLDV